MFLKVDFEEIYWKIVFICLRVRGIFLLGFILLYFWDDKKVMNKVIVYNWFSYCWSDMGGKFIIYNFILLLKYKLFFLFFEDIYEILVLNLNINCFF